MVMMFHMKLSIVALIVLSVSSFATSAVDLSQAQEHAAHMDRYGDAVNNGYEEAKHSQGRDADAMIDTVNGIDSERAQASADLNSAEQAAANAAAQSVANYGTKGNPNLNPQVNNYGTKNNPGLVSQVNPNKNPQAPVYSGTSIRPATGVTVPGYVVSKHPPFAGESWSNGRGTNSGSHDHSGTGNGSNNAANSNSAHGLGGGDHIGGGRSGGGYHY